MHIADLTTYLDEFLAHNQRDDSSKNGLQVARRAPEIEHIGIAVDVTTYLVDRAIAAGVDMLLVHHGLYWGYDTPLTGSMYERVKRLLDHDIAVYASHLPLDGHPSVGNNIALINARAKVGATPSWSPERFGVYKNQYVGYGIQFAQPLTTDMIARYCAELGLVPELYLQSETPILSCAVVSGGWTDVITQAADQWYDLLVTWEAAHHSLTHAKELGLNILLWWHYQTETLGIKLLAEHLLATHHLPYSMLDEVYHPHRWE